MVTIFALYLFGYRFGFVQDGWSLRFDFGPICYDWEAEEVNFYEAEEDEELAGWGSYSAPATAAESRFVGSLFPEEPLSGEEPLWSEADYDRLSVWP
jgi:hypothetical protein